MAVAVAPLRPQYDILRNIVPGARPRQPYRRLSGNNRSFEYHHADNRVNVGCNEDTDSRRTQRDTANKIVFHDVRFDDAVNPTKIYYSAIMSIPSRPRSPTSAMWICDKGAESQGHATNNGSKLQIDIDTPGADTIACALGSLANEEFVNHGESFILRIGNG